MNLSAFNNSSIMKKISFEIDGRELDTEGIISAEIFWNKNKFSVSGNLIIKDNMDIANLLPLNSENKITVYGEDNFDEFYFKTFMVADVREIRYKEKHKAYHISLIDVISYRMMNTFIGKSYSNKKTSDIVNDFFTKYKWKDLLDSHTKLIIEDTSVVHTSIIIPQDRNFLEFLVKQMEREGITMYQTRKEIIIGRNKDNLLPNKLEKIEHSFSQLHFLAEHPFRIHEHAVNLNPVLKQAQNSPISEIASFDFATKTMKKVESKFEEVFSDLKISTSELGNLQTTVGKKLGVQTPNNINNVVNAARESLMKNSDLSVVVTGNFKHTDIYKNADVVLSGNVEHNQGQAEGDVTMSGLYTIAAVTDKMINGRLIQKVDFERANFQENK